MRDRSVLRPAGGTGQLAQVTDALYAGGGRQHGTQDPGHGGRAVLPHAVACRDMTNLMTHDRIGRTAAQQQGGERLEQVLVTHGA